jgi:hypothetical protein
VTRGRGLLVLLFVLALPLVTPRIRASDEIEYFAYLPSLVFDHDVEFGDEYLYFYERNPSGLALFKGTFLDKREPETGRHINFGPVGSALLWLPFYLLAHVLVLLARGVGAGVPADGLSPPYVAATCYASALYGFLGLLVVHDALVRFGASREPAAADSTAVLWLATPALYYTTVAPGFSHAPSLFCVSILVWLWLRACDRGGGSILDWIAIGAAGGLAGLVREQDVLFLAAPAAWAAVRAVRTGAIRVGTARLLALGGTATLVFSPQLIVYRALTGQYRPSRMVSDKLDWRSPHFMDVLFDPGNGLFLWAPLLLLAVLGLAVAVRRRDPAAPFLALALVLQVWINGALSTWSQAGAFGSRRFVAATPIFAWGLAALAGPVVARHGRRVTSVVLALFVWWNVSLMVQFGLRLMDRQRLEWPRVARNQIVEVPQRLARTAWLYLTDRERLRVEGAPQ